MKTQENKKIFKMVAKIIGTNPKKISLQSNAKNIEEWDSLAILNIISFLEKKYKNKIKKFDVKDADSIKNIIKLFKKYKVKIWVLR